MVLEETNRNAMEHRMWPRAPRGRTRTGCWSLALDVQQAIGAANMRFCLVALLCLWSVTSPSLLVAGASPGMGHSGAVPLEPKARTPFKHFPPVSSHGRRKGMLGNLFLPCLPLFAPLNAAWWACASRWQTLQHELSGLSLFFYEQMDALIGGRDPIDYDSLKLHHDRPALGAAVGGFRASEHAKHG